MSIHIAIDPGASGGIAYRCFQVVQADPLPKTQRELVILFEGRIGQTLVIEQVPRFVPMFGGRGIPAAKSSVLFENYGFLKGAAMAAGLNVVEVPPQRWQKDLGLGNSRGMSKTDWKNKLKDKAQALFPHLKVTLKTADALLIWEWYNAKVSQ